MGLAVSLTGSCAPAGGKAHKLATAKIDKAHQRFKMFMGFSQKRAVCKKGLRRLGHVQRCTASLGTCQRWPKDLFKPTITLRGAPAA
jgi:hypothetical protein